MAVVMCFLVKHITSSYIFSYNDILRPSKTLFMLLIVTPACVCSSFSKQKKIIIIICLIVLLAILVGVLAAVFH